MRENKLLSFVFVLITLNIYLWIFAFDSVEKVPAGYYFLDVGQGDSEMMIFGDGAKILTDAGPNFEVVQEVQKILGFSSNYIDIGIITHAQADHFGGFADLLARYSFGVVLWSGVDSPESGSWQDLRAELAQKNIPLIATGVGTLISQGEDKIKILLPDEKTILAKDLNDSGIVQKASIGGRTALLTADISKKTENYLLSLYGDELKSDILKVPHHGSKTSAGDAFISAVDPSISVIEVGLKNRYGHPTKEMLAVLESIASKVLRTDLDGSLFFKPVEGGFEMFANN